MSAKQVVEALGGSGYLGSKPGLAGFWDRVTSRKPITDKLKTITAPPPALAPPVADMPPPEALLSPDLPAAVMRPHAPVAAPAASKSNGSKPSAAEPAVEAAEPLRPETDTKPLASAARNDPAVHAGANVTPRKPPARTFKSTLTLPEPDAPLPPRRPADIFGLSPPAAHALAPRPGTAVPAPRPARTPAGGPGPENQEVPQAEITPQNEIPVADVEIVAAENAAGSSPTPSAQDSEPQVAGESQPVVPADVVPVAANREPEKAQAAREINVEPKARLGQMLRKAGKKKPKSRQN
jgi:hypothetical protein